jgi:arsenate reductase-like glutaredoxin family protein
MVPGDAPDRDAPTLQRDGYPARMAPSPVPAGLQVQIFGLESDQATRAAIRFFKERRITIHLVDLRRKAIAAGELRRFVERLGAPALADRDGKAWRQAGLAYLKMTDTELAERLLADTRLLRLPLVRFGNAVSAGRAETTWKDWLSPRA